MALQNTSTSWTHGSYVADRNETIKESFILVLGTIASLNTSYGVDFPVWLTDLVGTTG